MARLGNSQHRTTGNPNPNTKVLRAGGTSKIRKVVEDDISPEGDPLSDREVLFVKYFVIYWNATKSAILAGYSAKTADSIGSQLKKNPKIQAAIKNQLDLQADDRKYAREKVLDFLERIIWGDMTEFLEVVKEGGVNKTVFKDSAALTTGAGQIINSITIQKHGIKIDIFSKEQALDMYNKILGHYKEDNTQRREIGPTFYMPGNGRDEVIDFEDVPGKSKESF